MCIDTFYSIFTLLHLIYEMFWIDKMCHFWCFQMEILIRGGHRNVVLPHPFSLPIVNGIIIHARTASLSGPVAVNSKELFFVTPKLSRKGANVCVQCVRPFTSSWISIKAEGRHSKMCNDVLVTWGDDRAAHLVAVPSIQCSGVKYLHLTHNGETEAWGGDMILL